MTARRQYNELTILEKLQVIHEVDKGLKTKTEIAKHYGIPQSTLSTYLKNREAIEKLVTRGTEIVGSRRRIRSAKYVNLEKELFEWFLQCKENDVQLSGPMLKEKGHSIAQKFGIDFKGSNGWLQRFQQRYDISLPLSNEPSPMKIDAAKREVIYSGIVNPETSILEIDEDVSAEENSWTIPITLESVDDPNQEGYSKSSNEPQEIQISDVTSKANEVQSYLFRRLTDAERKLAEIDEDESFCRMVISTIRRLPPRKNAEVKIKIMEILFEAEFGENEEIKQD